MRTAFALALCTLLFCNALCLAGDVTPVQKTGAPVAQKDTPVPAATQKNPVPVATQKGPSVTPVAQKDPIPAATQKTPDLVLPAATQKGPITVANGKATYGTQCFCLTETEWMLVKEIDALQDDPVFGLGKRIRVAMLRNRLGNSLKRRLTLMR